MENKHFDCVREWWDDKHEIVDVKEDDAMTTTYKAKKYTIDEIVAGGYNLDLCGYPTEEKIILSPEETMDNFVRRRAELDKLMDEKLDEIKKLLGGV